jgi:HprK-related kinase B
MIDRLESVHEWAERLRNGPQDNGFVLVLPGCRIAVTSNSATLVQRLRSYFGTFEQEESGRADLAISAVASAPLHLGIDWRVKRPDPGKRRIKEEFVDLPDGRIVRKRLTGMVFVFGDDLNLAVGPCLDNVNQVVNFIDNRFIEWHLDRGWLLCHAAAVTRSGRGVAMAGVSGKGKSTLALSAVSRGATFVSNDRLMIRRTGDGLAMLGVPKLPRVNPGTILNNPDLRGLVDPGRTEELSRMDEEELWELEDKHDVDIEGCFGPGRFDLRAPLDAVVLIDWRRGGGPLRTERVELEHRGELLGALRKNVGLFYVPTPGRPVPDLSEARYLEALEGCPVRVLKGGVDFAAAADVCTELLAGGTAE